MGRRRRGCGASGRVVWRWLGSRRGGATAGSASRPRWTAVTLPTRTTDLKQAGSGVDAGTGIGWRWTPSRILWRRPESWRYVRLQTNWRKPKGIDHHQRKQKSRGRPGLVKVGYGGPKDARGLHPSGFTDNLVYNISDLEKLDPKKDGVRLGHGVGTKKRKEIVVKAVENKFKIFNARVSVIANKS